jgi:hypothetical protein
MNLFYAHRPEEAIPVLEKALRLNPLPPAWYFYQLGRSYLMTGGCKETNSVAAKILRLNPKFSIVKTVRRYPYKNPSDAESMIDCLRKAGLPD